MRNGIIGVLIGAMLASAATVLGQTPMRLAKVGPVAATASDAIGAGTTPYTFLQTSAAVLTAQIKGSPGMAWDVECWNTDTAPAYIRRREDWAGIRRLAAYPFSPVSTCQAAKTIPR